jgi:hypothetical protein
MIKRVFSYRVITIFLHTTEIKNDSVPKPASGRVLFYSKIKTPVIIL